jgi:hypothetical protein
VLAAVIASHSNGLVGFCVVLYSGHTSTQMHVGKCTVMIAVVLFQILN